MNNNLELVSYKEYPQDKYTKAICIIRIDGKHVVAYGCKVGKNGNPWWAPASHSVDDGSPTKAFIEGYMVDSRSEEKKVLEFVRECAKQNSDLPF